MADPGGATAVDGEVRAAQMWVKRLPKSTDKLIELGRAWVVKARHSGDPGYYLNAEACADLVFEREPENWLAKELLAQVKNSHHKFAEAKDLCEQILARDPESFITLGVYSDVLFELGLVDDAIKAAERMVAFKPNLASYTRASFFQWIRGDTRAALASAKLAIEASNDPNQPEPKAYALVQTANFFWHQGDYEGADAGYKKALSTYTDYPPALVGRGRAALARGDAKGAVTFFEIAYKESPLVETAWRLGDAKALAGDARGAEEAYVLVEKLGRQTDRRSLAQFYAVKNRNIEEALSLAAAEMKERPGIYTEDAYAWALYRAGKFPEAKAHSDRATRFGFKDASLMYHAGAIRIATGDAKGGEKLVKDALALSPMFDATAAPEAQRLLGSLR